jgi:hypothetical protein
LERTEVLTLVTVNSLLTINGATILGNPGWVMLKQWSKTLPSGISVVYSYAETEFEISATALVLPRLEMEKAFVR